MTGKGIKALAQTSGSADEPRLDLLEKIFQKFASAPSETEFDDKLRRATGSEQAKQILIDM